MMHTPVNPANVAPAVGNYSHGLEVRNPARLLYISGQIPETPDSTIPADFEAQCEAVWANIERVLDAAGMAITDVVKVTTFLTAPEQADLNGAIRRKHLGDHAPALTVIVAQTLDPRWLLEIEAIAAASE